MADTNLHSTPTWKRAVGYAGALALGVVLLVAAYGKALDPNAFAEQIVLEGVSFLLPAAAVALIAIALEVGLGTALVLNLRRLWVLVPAALLSLFFVYLNGRAWYLIATGRRTEEAACGCFGNLVERTPEEAFWQDLLLLGVPLALAFVGRPGPGHADYRAVPPLRTAVAVLATVFAAGFAWRAPELPLDDLATRLSPGTEVLGLCAGAEPQRVCFDAVLPEVEEGDHLVVMSGLEDPELTGAIDRLNAYALDAVPEGAPALWLVNPDPLEAQRAFYWQWGPAFEVREAPPALLRPLYRTLPRSFLVRDGEVEETWSGLPPLDRLASAAAPPGEPSTAPETEPVSEAAAGGTPIAYRQPSES